MSSGAGEASGAGGLDLNCNTVAVLDNHEADVGHGLEDAPVNTGCELLDRESADTMDVGVDEKKECAIGITDREDGMMGNGEGSAGSDLGGVSEVGVAGTVSREAGAEFHGGKLLEVEFEEKGSAELVSVSTVGFEDVEASSQTLNLGDRSVGDQKRGADIHMEGVMGTDEVSLTALVGGGGTEDERLYGSSTLRREQVEVQVVDGAGEPVNGQLDLEEREPEGESITVRLMEVNAGDKEITDLLTVSAEKFEAIDASNQAVGLGNAEGYGEREAEVISNSGKFLKVEEEDGSTELAVVSTEEFEPFETSIRTVVFHDGFGGDLKRGTDLDAEVDLGEKGSAELVIVSTVGFEVAGASDQAMYLGDGSDDDQNRVTYANKEGMVGTDEDYLAGLVCGGGAEDERLEGLSSNLREEQTEVDLVDGGVQVEDVQLGAEEREAEGVSLHIKPLEMDTGEREGADLVAISAEKFEASNQAVMERDTGGSESADLVAVSAEEVEAVEPSNQAVDLGDGSGSDQKQGIDLDAEGIVIDGQLGPGEREGEVKSYSGNVLEMDKEGDGSAVLISVSTEEFQTVEAGNWGGKLLKVETGVEGGDEPYAISAEGFEAVETSSQSADLEHGYCGDQKKGTDVDAEYVVETSRDSVNVSGAILARSLLLVKEHTEVLQDLMDDGHDQALDGEFSPGEREAEVEPHSAKFLELDVREKGSKELASVPAGASGAVEASSQDMDVEDRYSSEQKEKIIADAACMVRTDEDSVVSIDGGGPEDEMLSGSSNLVKEVEVVEETCGTGSKMKDLPNFSKNEITGYDIMIHTALVQTEFDGGQKQGTDADAEIMVGGTEQTALAASFGGGGLEDERLVTSYKIEEKQVDVGEDNTGPRTPAKKMAHIQMIGGAGVDAMRDTGHVKDTVYGKHVADLYSREGFGDHRTESCMESKEEPLAVAVFDQGDEAQGLEIAPRPDGEQVEFRCGDDGSQMVEEVAHFQNSGDLVHVDVCDFVEGHPDERESEIVGDNGYNVSGVNSEFSAREENMIEKGLVCLPESVDAVHDFMDHALDDRDPGSDGHDQETLVTHEKQDIGFESIQGSGLELMGVETGIVRHSTVGSERVKVLPQTSFVENEPKIYDENNTLTGATVQKLDSIPIIEERDTGLQQVDGDMRSTVVSGSPVGCLYVAKNAMALDAAVNVEAWGSNEHTSVDDMVEKGNVLLEDNGSVMNVISAELQNGDAQQNFNYQNQKIDSSSLMVPCREEEIDVSGSHSPANFFMEDSNSLLGISIPDSSAELINLTITPQWNEPSVGCQDLRPSNIPSREDEELEPKQGIPALESALYAVDETVDCSQKLQDGTPENLKESEIQSEECDGTRTESASTGRQATYYLSFPDKEGFSTSDLVWGKVKSHPWWPGQIFDFSGASQLAIKYQKKDHFLVAYFGDKTFAWCEESRLKPFLSYFSQMENQTSTDSFLRALCDILVEISRRVVLSMTCSCLPEETYADIKYQKVENAGVQGKIVNSVFDRCEVVDYFHPDQLVDYLRELAQIPTGGADRLEFTVAKAQLKAFYLLKGYTDLPAFTNGSGLVENENDFETPSSTSQKLNDDDLEHSATLSDLFSTKGKLRGRDGTLGKQKQIVEDGRKQKSLSELMEEETTFLLVNKHENASEVLDGENCLSSGNKRKALDFVSTDIGRSKTKKFDSQADEETKLPSPTSNSSFKVGAFISRAASKLTSGQPIRKCLGETSERGLSRADDWTVDYMDLDDFLDVPFDRPKLQIEISGDFPPTNEMLSKLYLAARNPLKGYNFSSIVINFFCTFRNVQVSNISIEKNTSEKPRAKRGRKKKIILDLESPDMSTPDHMKDSYWSDMIIPEKDGPLNPPKRRGRKKRKFIDESSTSLVLSPSSECEPKFQAGTMCPHVKHMLTAERPIISVEEKIVDERTPTAVILYFNSSNSLPSDMDLIRIFSRYGPLKEEETYIERKNNSAMVVFKKRTDAEMAFSSAGKFSTFGPALLSYRLRHFPLKSSPVDTLTGEDDTTPIKDGHLGILVKPEISGAMNGNLCEAVDKESSIFVQSQGHVGPVLDMPTGEFSELARYHVGDVAVSSSALADSGRKEPLQDVPAQMETGSGSDHLLLESLDQEFSYFDLDQAETGDISGTEDGGEKSSGSLLEILEVSRAANDKSLGDRSRDPASDAETPKQVAVTGTPDSLSKQWENGTVLETVDQEFSVCALPSEAKDTIPDEIKIAPDQPGGQECSDSLPVPDQSSVTVDVQLMEADSIAEQKDVITESDSAQIELERRDPSVSITNAEAAGMPSLVTEVCISEQRTI